MKEINRVAIDNFINLVISAAGDGKNDVACTTGFYDCLKANGNLTDSGEKCEIACSFSSLNYPNIGLVLGAIVLIFF